MTPNQITELLKSARDRRVRRQSNLLTAKAFDTSATLNPILTTIANQFMRDPSGFVGTRIFPPFSSGLQSGQYYVFTPGELAQVASLRPRAPGSAYSRLKQTISNDSFACSDWGIEGPVPDEDRKKYAAYFDADLSTVRRLIDTIRVNHEQRVYALVTGGTVPSATIGVPWNDGSSNPKTDVDAARENIRQQIGLLPNLLVITQPMLNTLSIHPLLRDLFKYTIPGVLDEDRLAAAFQIDQVAVARNVIANNNEGQTFTPADIWGNNAVVAHMNDEQDLMVPNFGRTFYWSAFSSEVNLNTGGTGPAMTTGGGGPDLMQVFSYRDETVKADIHRTEHYTAEKLTGATAGYILQNPLH